MYRVVQPYEIESVHQRSFSFSSSMRLYLSNFCPKFSLASVSASLGDGDVARTVWFFWERDSTSRLGMRLFGVNTCFRIAKHGLTEGRPPNPWAQVEQPEFKDVERPGSGGA